MTNAEQIAQSASYAAWAGAAASTLASMVALGVAVWGAHREENRRRRLAQDQETAFAFGMVGALEMIKPLIVEAKTNPSDATTRRRYLGMVEHAHTITLAALGIPIFDMQMLRDAYHFRGALNYLRALPEDHLGAIPNEAIWSVVSPMLDDLVAADDRFFARLPSISDIRGVGGRTPIPGYPASDLPSI